MCRTRLRRSWIVVCCAAAWFACSAGVGRGAETVHANWQVVDVGTGIKPSFDFDASGRIHVMGMTEAVGGMIWHAVSDSIVNPWSNMTVATGYFYGPGDLRVDPQGAAHLAWHNHDLTDPDHVIVDATGLVTRTTIVTPGHNGWDNSLAIGPSGTVHMASVWPSSFGATDSLEYGFLTGTTWTYTVSIPGSDAFMYGLNTSCAVDSDGAMHVAYCKAADWIPGGDLRYASMTTGGVWNISTIVAGEGRGRFPSLALDGQDTPHIAWIDVDPATNSMAYVRYAKHDGAQWQIETVDTLQNVSMGFSGARKSVSLALDSNDRVHLAYGDKCFVRYARKFGGSWHLQTVLEETSGAYNGLVVLRLDPWDKPGIVFWQPVPVAPGTVRFARPHVGSFFLTAIAPDSGGDVLLDWESGGGDVVYRVNRAGQLSPPAWTNIHGTGFLAQTSWTDTNTQAGTPFFYHVEGMQNAPP